MAIRERSIALVRGKDRPAGFTLIELVIVLVLLGILFSFSVVSISGLTPIYSVRSASRNVAAKIEYLRALSINQGRPMGIRYTLLDEPHYYEVIHPPPADLPDLALESRDLGPKIELPEGVRFNRISFPGTRGIERGAVNVLFSPMGNTGSHVVVLEGRSKSGQPILISVKFNAITGTVDFVQGEAGFEHHEG